MKEIRVIMLCDNIIKNEAFCPWLLPDMYGAFPSLYLNNCLMLWEVETSVSIFITIKEYFHSSDSESHDQATASMVSAMDLDSFLT